MADVKEIWEYGFDLSVCIRDWEKRIDYIIDLKRGPCANNGYLGDHPTLEEVMARFTKRGTDISKAKLMTVVINGIDGSLIIGWKDGGADPFNRFSTPQVCPYTPMELLEAVYASEILTDERKEVEFMKKVVEDGARGALDKMVEDYKNCVA